jgi:mRNA-degrading endonuclease RelE of RelBE toxin-antitoxin system
LQKFKVVYSAPVAKYLEGIPKKKAELINNKVEAISDYPFPSAKHGKKLKKLETLKIPTYRLRTGKDRVIYRVENQQIIVLKIIPRDKLEREIKKRFKL